MYLSKKVTRFDFSVAFCLVSIQLVTNLKLIKIKKGMDKMAVNFIKNLTYGFHPKSCGFKYKIPALETVAGVAVLKLDISKRRRMAGVRAILSLLANVNT